MNQPSRMMVGPSDAIRCALALLLPSWFYVVGLITAVAAASGAWSRPVNTYAAVTGFGVAVGIEILRRIVLLSRPGNNYGVITTLRSIMKGLPFVGALSIGILLVDLLTGCFGKGCGEDAEIAIGLWLGLDVLCVFTTPALRQLLKHSAWLNKQPTQAHE